MFLIQIIPLVAKMVVRSSICVRAAEHVPHNDANLPLRF